MAVSILSDSLGRNVLALLLSVYSFQTQGKGFTKTYAFYAVLKDFPTYLLLGERHYTFIIIKICSGNYILSGDIWGYFIYNMYLANDISQFYLS